MRTRWWEATCSAIWVVDRLLERAPAPAQLGRWTRREVAAARMSERARFYRHRIAVRWGEVDQQGVVFNAHYLAYMDDAMETWLRPIRALGDELGWDMMLKRCSIEWHGPLGARDLLDVDLAVARWGRTSWDLGYRGTCGGRLVFTARVVYVSVASGTSTPMETPHEIREFMGEAVDLLGDGPAA